RLRSSSHRDAGMSYPPPLRPKRPLSPVTGERARVRGLRRRVRRSHPLNRPDGHLLPRRGGDGPPTFGPAARCPLRICLPPPPPLPRHGGEGRGEGASPARKTLTPPQPA